MSSTLNILRLILGLIITPQVMLMSCDSQIKTEISAQTVSGSSNKLDSSIIKFEPADGTYTEAQSVTVSSSVTGTKIYYTTDGSTPTTSSAVYSDAIPVATTTTIKTLVTKSGTKKTAQASATYTINSTSAISIAETPVFSPAAGTYATAQTVTISSGTTGASIYYTTDGSTPTTSSTLFSGAVSVAVTQNIKAIAVKSGFSNSSVATGDYIINGTIATPTFSPADGAYGPTQNVTISSLTSDVTIYYTTDGSTPTTSSTVYSGAISVATTQTIKAYAIKASYTDSAVATASYTINGAVATPTSSVPSGSYGPAQSVTISTATSGAAIYYTTDGSTPSTSSILYSGAISVSSSQTIKAYALKTGYSDSAVATATYTINGTVATPTFSPAGGAYGPTQSVSITSATSGATIYYTTDGSTPSTSSTQYSGAISVATTQTIKAFAIKSSYTDSAVATASYTINGAVQTPVAIVAGGSYSNNQSVTLATVPMAASIYYTTDGSTPNNTKTLYTGAVTISGTTTLKAIGIMSGYSDSTVMTETYTLTAGTPTADVAQGAYGPEQTVNLSSTTTGTTIYWTTDGSTPTCTGSTGTVNVSSSMTVKAIACKTNYSSSAVASFIYTINGAVATPTFSVAGGAYGPAQSVSLSTTTSGATIYYTTDGNNPTTSSAVYSTAINVSSSQTIKAFAVKADYIDSAVATATYTINGAVATPTFSPGGGAQTGTINVSISTTTSGATIYYTTDGATPSTSSSVYSSAISVSSTQTLKAFAVKASYVDSSVASATFTFDSTPPTVSSFSRAAGQGIFSKQLPVDFTITFSEALDPASFTSADISNVGSATGVTWTVSTTDNITWTVSATAASSYGTVVPLLAESAVTDAAGNSSAASTILTSGGVTYDAPGVNNAMSGFRLQDSEVLVPPTAALHSTGDYTVEMWVSYDQSQTVWATMWYGGDFGFLARTPDTGMYWKYFYDTGVSLLSVIPANTGTWQHVAFVRHGSTGKLFVNGILNASGPIAAVYNIDFTSADYGSPIAGYGLVFGRAGPPYYQDTDNYVNASVNGVSVSNVARYTSDFVPSLSIKKDANTLMHLAMPDSGAANLYDAGTLGIAIATNNISRVSGVPTPPSFTGSGTATSPWVITGLSATSCLNIRQNSATNPLGVGWSTSNGLGQDGTYQITISSVNYKVYCDMTNNGGGWTLMVNAVGGSTPGAEWSTQTAGVSTSNYGDLTKTYRLSDSLINALKGAKGRFTKSAGTSPTFFATTPLTFTSNTMSAVGNVCADFDLGVSCQNHTDTDDNFGPWAAMHHSYGPEYKVIIAPTSGADTCTPAPQFGIAGCGVWPATNATWLRVWGR